MDNLGEMEKFLEKYNLPRLNQEETEDMNRPFTSTKIKAVIKNLPQNKSREPDGFTGEFYETFREELMPVLLKLFQKLQRKEYFPTHTGTSLLHTKIRQKQYQENYIHIPHEHGCKNSQ